jgi:sterol desaturase/sphingolipid hydroxylase (fatty acid hydroxylase superfamily)
MSGMTKVYITLGIFLSINLVALVWSYLVLYTDLLAKYRIQPRPYKKAIFFERLPLIAFNATMVLSLAVAGMYFNHQHFVTNDPNWIRIPIEVFVVLAADDIAFYFIHRWMHENKWLYKKVHIIHHRAYQPFPLEYIYVHPLEWMTVSMGLTLGFVGIFLVMGNIHFYSFIIFAVIRNLHEVDIHSGTRSVFAQFIPLWGEAEHHDLHHAKPTKGNYASMFKFWDKLLGTEIDRNEVKVKEKKTPAIPADA